MGRRIAILVGNGSFQPNSGLENLRGPANDVAHLASVLQDPERGGFEVQVLVDRSKSDVLPAVEEAINGASIEDLVLVFYAGHGKPDPSGRLCLATAETRESALRATSIPASELTALLGQPGPGSVVLLLDCCFSGAIGKEFFRGSTTDELRMLVQDASGLHIITATTGTQTARERESEDGGLVMGAFTRQLVVGLRSGVADRNGDGLVTLSDLEQHLVATVRGQSPRRTTHDASGDPLIAKARPLRSPEEKRLERLGSWLAKGKLTTELYHELVGTIETRERPELATMVERLLDDPKTSAKSLTGAWNGAKAPEAPPPVPYAPPIASRRAAMTAASFATLDPKATTAAPRGGTLWTALRFPLALAIVSAASVVGGIGVMFVDTEEKGQMIGILGFVGLFAAALWAAIALLRFVTNKIKAG